MSSENQLSVLEPSPAPSSKHHDMDPQPDRTHLYLSVAIFHAGWGKYPSAATIFDQLTNPAQSVSVTAATRSVEPVSTELLSLPARACFTGNRVQQNETLNGMTR
ncbi:hypothetical protein J6590_085201 [Homalodisca vitripennis]|nr:hypothetical protein J6590_085201 [Homalodisca vitripennis]